MTERTQRLRGAGAVAAVVVLAVGQIGAAATQGNPGSPRAIHGSSGIGDPYFPLTGNGGIDVTHYDLTLHYTPPAAAPAPLEGKLKATATISLTPTQDLDKFSLDLRGLTATGVSVDGKPMSFTQVPNELVITPRPKLKTNRPVKVVVQYDGTTTRPTDIEGGLYGWVTTRDGAMVANEPDAAATWFPVNDHPLDKATYDFRVTVPEGLVAVANGNLVGQKTTQGWTTWSWHAPDQMASYLATASVGNFELRTYKAPNGVPIIDALDRDLQPAAYAGLAQQGEMLVYFESLFGAYPFTSYGAIVDDDSIGYALETQTRPIYSSRATESTVAHELSHQWLGNAVSPARWQDVWLNEGWATYSEWLWAEHDGGATAQSQFDSVMDQPATNPFWDLEIADPSAMHSFADPVYDRGGATLHALRLKVGDNAFFTIAREWVSRYDDSTATTEDFEALAAELSGRDLNAFFDVWLHTPDKPTTW